MVCKKGDLKNVANCLFAYYIYIEIDIMYRVRMIVSYFANCEVNSSYCNCKVVNHMKNVKQFFPKGYFIHVRFFHIISKLYPHFTHPLYTVFHKKYCLYPKLHHKMQKMLLNSYKNPSPATG